MQKTKGVPINYHVQMKSNLYLEHYEHSVRYVIRLVNHQIIQGLQTALQFLLGYWQFQQEDEIAIINKGNFFTVKTIKR